MDLSLQEAQDMVRAFHIKYSAPRDMLRNPIKDREAWLHVGHQRNRLILEEHFEMICAWHDQDVVELADGLTDLLYASLQQKLKAAATT